ncbi:hypothetical protein [Chryseobacterium sp. MYb328]|uniref:hypothetical protein n=1 Tax=Chryseobacterium sp. MYb328 TaxID=2745231 RepID=UPI0030B5025D
MKKIISLLGILMFVISCNGQGKESYWKGQEVTKESKEPFHGVTLAYMEMIAEMRIYLSKNDDSLVFTYPYEKKIKVSELKSLTGCRLKDGGKLLDSVYDVRVEGDQLKIKFYYIGTASKDNRFSLNLVRTDKASYIKETETLKNEKNRVLEMIKPADVSGLGVSISIPEYFKPDININLLNPIQLAEDLCQVKGIQTLSSSESFKVGQEKYNYRQYELVNADQVSRIAARIGTIDFPTFKLVTNQDGSRTDAWMVGRERSDKKTIQSIFRSVQSKYPNADIIAIGAPEIAQTKDDVVGIASTFGVTMTNSNEIIRILISIPEELYGIKQEATGSKEVAKAFEYYISLIGTAEIQVKVISKKLNDLLNAKNFSGDRPYFLSEE